MCLLYIYLPRIWFLKIYSSIITNVHDLSSMLKLSYIFNGYDYVMVIWWLYDDYMVLM